MRKRPAPDVGLEYLDHEEEHRSPHGCDEVFDDDQDEGLAKKEVIIAENEQSNEWPAPKDSPKAMEDNLALALLSCSPITSFPSLSSSTMVSGKRARKPKQIYAEEIPQIKKKKAMTCSKMKTARNDFAGKSFSCKQENVDWLNTTVVKSPTMIRAEEVRLSLGPDAPCFAKLLVRSHVASCFWMALPGSFCRFHLSRMDSVVILEDENGEQYEVKYIAEKPGLSAGWRNFAIEHKLVAGDVLVFHLVDSNKFKVYIIRANDLTEVDGALSLLNLDTQPKQNDAELASVTPINKKKRCPKSLTLDMVQKKNRKIDSPRSAPLVGLVEQSENDSEEVGSEVVQNSGSSAPALWFKDIRTFDDFHILVNGSCLDSELPDHVRMKYYEICCTKNAFLHDRLIPGLYSKLIAGIIFEMVNIADSIKACNLNTSRDEFATWDKSLQSFELLGMNASFLRARLHRLQSLAFDSEGASHTQRYLEAITERNQAEDDIQDIEVKLTKLKEASQKLDAEIQTLKLKVEKHEIKFQQEVNAPW